MPGGRALIALAGVGTFLAWQGATGTPDHSYAVAAGPIRPGERITDDLVRFEPMDLPAEVAEASFSDAGMLVDRVALGPIGDGELLQRAQLSDQGDGQPSAEVSFALDRDRAVDGRLRSGDLVDVFATRDGRTDAVAEGLRIVAVGDDDGGSFSGSRQVTVTIALSDPAGRAALVHAVREGEVTLVRSTHRSVPAPVVPSAPAGEATPPAGSG